MIRGGRIGIQSRESVLTELCPFLRPDHARSILRAEFFNGRPNDRLFRRNSALKYIKLQVLAPTETRVSLTSLKDEFPEFVQIADTSQRNSAMRCIKYEALVSAEARASLIVLMAPRKESGPKNEKK